MVKLVSVMEPNRSRDTCTPRDSSISPNRLKIRLTHSSQVQQERPLNICALKSDRTDAEKRGEGDRQRQRRKSRGCFSR